MTKITDKSKEFEKGNKIHFVPPHKRDEQRYKHNVQNGIVKEVTPEGVFVVFHVGDSWENFEQYTAQLSDPNSLFHGWL